MRFAIALIVLTIFACAALASHQHKPFPLLVDADAPVSTEVMVCRPMLFDPRREKPEIVRT